MTLHLLVLFNFGGQNYCFDLFWSICFLCVSDLQYAMFLTLVFLAELVAGISGFVFRHEVILLLYEGLLNYDVKFIIFIFIYSSFIHYIFFPVDQSNT